MSGFFMSFPTALGVNEHAFFTLLQTYMEMITKKTKLTPNMIKRIGFSKVKIVLRFLSGFFSFLTGVKVSHSVVFLVLSSDVVSEDRRSSPVGFSSFKINMKMIISLSFLIVDNFINNHLINDSDAPGNILNGFVFKRLQMNDDL